MKEKTVWEKASRLLNDDKVRARVEQLQAKMEKKSEITKEKVLEQLKNILDADIRDYVMFDGVDIRFKAFDQLTDQQAKAIESIKQSKSGIELKLHGKNWSIERINSMLGFNMPAKVSQTDSEGNDILQTSLSPDQIEKLIDKL
jgi:metal-sulfur cluster biosynthetic enzyme